MFLIRFWRSLTKKDSVESAKCKEEKNSVVVLRFLDVFFHGFGSGYLADPDPD